MLTAAAKHNIETSNGMPAKINVVGQRFGKITVKKDAPGTVAAGGKKIRQVSGICDCGKPVIVRVIHLLSGHTTSCGCSRADGIAVHGHARRGKGGKTPTWVCWRNMIRRCNEPKNKRYNRYGGRGIAVCKRWLESFDNFLADMGIKPPGLTLERINTNGNYEPGNCRWATWLEQNQNRTKDFKSNVRGVTGSLLFLCRHFGLESRYASALRRHHKGWTPEEAIFTPSGRRKPMSMP